GLAPPAPCRSPGAPVSKRAQAKNAQNCFLYWLLPTVVASAIGFQIDEIEMEFLQENSAWEFSHSLDQKQKSWRSCGTSALPPITDMQQLFRHVRKVPISEGRRQEFKLVLGGGTQFLECRAFQTVEVAFAGR